MWYHHNNGVFFYIVYSTCNYYRLRFVTKKADKEKGAARRAREKETFFEHLERERMAVEEEVGLSLVPRPRLNVNVHD